MVFGNERNQRSQESIGGGLAVYTLDNVGQSQIKLAAKLLFERFRKYSLEKSMYDFTYRTNYTKGDFDIEENWYNQEYQRGILYFCDNGEELIVINYKGPLDVDLEDSPVGVILDSLE